MKGPEKEHSETGGTSGEESKEERTRKDGDAIPVTCHMNVRDEAGEAASALAITLAGPALFP